MYLQLLTRYYAHVRTSCTVYNHTFMSCNVCSYCTVAKYVSSIIMQTRLLTLGIDVNQNMSRLMMEEIITMVSFSC